MASLLVRFLLALVCGFAALSSSVAAALGLAEERILAFTGLVSALLLLAVPGPAPAGPAERPRSPAGLLAAGILLTDLAGHFDPVDAKIVLPVLVLVAAPNLARFLSAEALLRFVWRLLSFYVAATFFYRGGSGARGGGARLRGHRPLRPDRLGGHAQQPQPDPSRLGGDPARPEVWRPATG